MTYAEDVVEYDERTNRAGRTVRTATTNVGSLRTGDYIAQTSYADAVTVVEPSNGTTVKLRTTNLQTGRSHVSDWPVTATVRIVHPDDAGRDMPEYR